jgi:hypothetical protein
LPLQLCGSVPFVVELIASIDAAALEHGLHFRTAPFRATFDGYVGERKLSEQQASRHRPGNLEESVDYRATLDKHLL